ncbi:MAG: DUF362 domain-containing protein [Firmicutes bacterium]|nr:DUF362 domain-containing protein [Bacillota bacterium]
MKDVAVVPCESYEASIVEASLREALEETGGLDFVQPGMKIIIKANLVTAMKPDAAATPHPSVVCALVKMLLEKGAEVTIGDSPGGIYSAPYLKVVYDVCGMREAEKLGAKLNNDFSTKEIDDPSAVQAKHFTYTAYLDQADAIIDLCKLKTHGMMGMSCGVKNFFGTVPGTMKPEYHYKYPKAEDFADVLVDLFEHFKPRLCVCDAVIGMEGNGPTQGTPRKIGCLLVSANAHALDEVAAGIIGLGVKDVPTLSAAVRRGLLAGDGSGYTVYGDPSRFRVPDYQTIPSQGNVFFHVLGTGPIGKVADWFVSRVLTPFPKLSSKDCVGCQKCANVCPAKAITMVDKKPKIKRSSCIHCFCCQEFCPKGAMKVGRTIIARIASKV